MPFGKPKFERQQERMLIKEEEEVKGRPSPFFHQINYLKLGPNLNPRLKTCTDGFEKALQKF